MVFADPPRAARLRLALRDIRERRFARALSRLPTLDTSPTSAIATMTTTAAIPKPVIDLTAFRSPEARPSAPRRAAGLALHPSAPCDHLSVNLSVNAARVWGVPAASAAQS